MIMRTYLIATAFFITGLPAYAVQDLPSEFFLECDGTKKAELLVFVDLKGFFYFKKPILKVDKFINSQDALSTTGFYPSVFNKWNSTFVHDEVFYDNCTILDRNSRTPIYQ